MGKWALILMATLIASFTAVAVEEPAPIGDPATGFAKAFVCVACHNADGNSTTPIWPKIAGLSESYIIKQMLEFQKGPKGDRNSPTMFGIVQNLTPQDIADLAAYYSTQEMSIGSVAPDKVALGQKIYRGGNLLSGVPACAACHDPAGKGNYLANFPRLGGQNSQYIIEELSKFKNKERINIMMNDIAARLTAEETQAVASYVEGLH